MRFTVVVLLVYSSGYDHSRDMDDISSGPRWSTLLRGVGLSDDKSQVIYEPGEISLGSFQPEGEHLFSDISTIQNICSMDEDSSLIV